MAAFDIRSILIMPLRDGDRTIGYIAFDERGQARQWTDRDLRLAEGIGRQVVNTIRNARLFDETRRIREELEVRVQERTRELAAAHEEIVASERLAAVGILAREVAHGLRNPLNVVSTSVYFLRSRFPNPDEKANRHFDTVQRAVEQAADTITQLMSLADSGPSLVRMLLYAMFTFGVVWVGLRRDGVEIPITVIVTAIERDSGILFAAVIQPASRRTEPE